RITTFSILILSALSLLGDLSQAGDEESEKNKKRAEQLRNSYIGYLDPVTLISRSKLELNRHNNRFYQKYIAPLELLPQRGLSSSEHLLRKAFIWFKDHLKSHNKGNGETVASFVDSIVDKLFFTVITVTDELNAFKVFETLNSRGVRLSSTDLLKNYLFSVANSECAHDTEMKTLEERWEDIVGILGSESFPEFLRVYWNSRNKLVRKSDLFKTIRRNITSKAQAFGLIRDLDAYARIYAALQKPYDELWQPKEREYLKQLKMFDVRQPLSLLLTVFQNFAEINRKDFESLLRSISVISFRYNVICNMQSNEQERVYNDAAVQLSSGKLQSAKEVLQLLKKVYPEDSAFKAAFADKELRTTSSRNKKIVRYILLEMEEHASGKPYEFESDRYNIEHIMPEHPGEQWPDYDEHQ
ncbi:MAG: DUF262 domain-containing protein, partial [Candidatus Heimdallarchaeota archaeon]|nr:DUF262 domain-containing protein [Candidatus Heimdallarchaeota archaeon]